MRVGAFTSIGAGVRLALGGNHRPDWVTTYPLRAAWGLPGEHVDGHPRPERDIEIGSDVWHRRGRPRPAGRPDRRRRRRGRAAVVTKDVRPYAIVAGNPAREVRRRFDDETVAALLAVRWWEWPDERVRAHADVLCSPRVAELLALARDGAGPRPGA